MRELLKQHIGTILSNRDNKSVVLRIRKYLQEKISYRGNLLALREELKESKKTNVKVFTAKFSYA